jgi:flagellar protein FliJ
MKKPASLHTVLEVGELRRSQALQALAQVQGEQRHAEQQMALLSNYGDEAQARWSQRASQGVSPALLHAHRAFMARIDHAQQFQQGVLERLAQRIEHCRRDVMTADRELASLNKVAQRRDQTWQRHLDRQEQKHNDEMAATLHRQQRSTHDWRNRP